MGNDLNEVTLLTRFFSMTVKLKKGEQGSSNVNHEANQRNGEASRKQKSLYDKSILDTS